MSGEIRSINNEVLIVGEDVEAVVNNVLADESLTDLQLGRVPSLTPPAGVALLRSAAIVGGTDHHGEHAGGTTGGAPVNLGNDLVNQVRAAGHGSAHPNYKMVQLTHGRVLPISYPRPATPRNIPTTDDPSDVDVLIIDSALLTPSPLDGLVEGTAKSLTKTVDVPTAEFHSLFVAGIVRIIEPRARVRVEEMANSNNDPFISDWELACQIQGITTGEDPPRIINLSLGSLAAPGDKPRALERAIAEALSRDIHILAAAGNDGLANDIVFAAKFPGVLSVGAQAMHAAGPSPADWSNGSSAAVDFWAPGVSIVSTTVEAPSKITFEDEQLKEPNAVPHTFQDLPQSHRENVQLDGWGCWEGTSFATPIVAAALASLIIDGNQDPIAALRLLFGTPTNTTGFTGTYAVDRCDETAMPQQSQIQAS